MIDGGCRDLVDSFGIHQEVIIVGTDTNVRIWCAWACCVGHVCSIYMLYCTAF